MDGSWHNEWFGNSMVLLCVTIPRKGGPYHDSFSDSFFDRADFAHSDLMPHVARRWAHALFNNDLLYGQYGRDLGQLRGVSAGAAGREDE